jgi:hypothetical protein
MEERYDNAQPARVTDVNSISNSSPEGQIGRQIGEDGRLPSSQ